MSFTNFLKAKGYDVDKLRKQTHSHRGGIKMLGKMRKSVFKNDFRSRLEMKATRVMYELWKLWHKYAMHHGRVPMFDTYKHTNPYTRAYIDLDKALKLMKKDKV